MSSFSLKDNFKLGVASASTQIEGGDVSSNWNDWYNKGNIKDGSNPANANDHYNRFREDIDIMASLGIKHYRFSIEWARIEPREGIFSREALNHYREEILYMKQLGISPLLTLHHFSNPMWFENMGAFYNPKSTKIFLRFVEKVVSFLGDIVDEYITINEPNVYATMSYFFGDWPPGVKSFKHVRQVYKNLADCHIKSYKLIHKMREEMDYYDTKVSFANHIRIFEPKSKFNLYHKIGASLMEYAFQGAITKLMSTGKSTLLVKKPKGVYSGKYYDFLGINYYTRSLAKGFKDEFKENVPVNDLGWEIYPLGIVRACALIYKKYPAPIYITENGTCDNNDTFRCKYIYDHLFEIASSSLPIDRYYHWSFTDNFEWIEGESKRFGIVYVDYNSQERKVKKSGEFYKEVIKENGVTQKMYDTYVKEF